MNRIKTEQDVLDWAKVIVDGNGEKYVPLGKGDMYEIAKYVLGCRPTLEAPPAVEETTPPPSPAEEPKDETDGEKLEEPIETEESPKVTALALLGARGMHTAQEAFDAFLKDTAKDEKTRRVIDFSNGSMNVGPAFTWWILSQFEEVFRDGL